MSSAFVGLRSATASFYIEYEYWDESKSKKNERIEYPGTVQGAIDLRTKLDKLFSDGCMVMMSSDLNHPSEFPMFEEKAIDIAANGQPETEKYVRYEDYVALEKKYNELISAIKEAAGHITKLQKHINALEHGNVKHAEARK